MRLVRFASQDRRQKGALQGLRTTKGNVVHYTRYN